MFINGNQIIQQFTKSGIDFTTLGSTLIGTTDSTGRRFIVTSISLLGDSVSALTVPPIVSIGTVATAYNNILSALTGTGLITNGIVTSVLSAITPTVPTGTGISIKVNTAAIATTCTGTVIVQGFYI